MCRLSKQSLETHHFLKFGDRFFTEKYIQYKPKVDPAFNHFGPIEIRVETDYPIGTSFGRINFGVILYCYPFHDLKFI